MPEGLVNGRSLDVLLAVVGNRENGFCVDSAIKQSSAEPKVR